MTVIGNFRQKLLAKIATTMLASEPHYLWMEAGTNAFADHTLTTDQPTSSAPANTPSLHSNRFNNHVRGRMNAIHDVNASRAPACL